jgi:hypothetical protein
MPNSTHPDKNKPTQPVKTAVPPVKTAPMQPPAQPVKTVPAPPVQPAKTVPVQPQGKP